MGGGEVPPPPAMELLATKFLPPVARPGYVRRERLLRRLDGVASTPIALVSAPAGFGKTTLLAGWLDELQMPWAWLSIDEQDNDPGRLWPHLIAALGRLAGPVGGQALSELRLGGGRGSIDRWLTPLINDLAATSAPESCLVLDDLHALTDADQRAAVGVLAGHLPGWLHLVLSTRADPPIPLPRLRADRRITEVREADLRFATAEADLLLAASGVTALSPGQVAQLVELTEGWAAGLQLATITMGDPALGSRVQDVVGSLRTFTDYLITEVVDQQPPRMRDFLYATALVDQVNPALARVLSGAPDAGRMLRQAEQQGLFVAALDGRDEWYRYHHLFAEALRHELRVRSPERAVAIHRRAAAWFEARGEAASALEHWLAAGRPEEALRLAIDVGFALSDRGQAGTVERIARRIPPAALGDDPARQLDYGMLCHLFEPESFLAWVGQATRTLAALDDPDHDIVTQCLTARSLADHCVGDWDEAFDHAVEAVDRGASGPGRPVSYGERARLQVIRAAGWLDRLEEADAAFHAYVDDPRMPDAPRLMVAPAAWAMAVVLAGRIDDADEWVGKAAAAGVAGGFRNLQSVQEMALTRAMVAHERGDAEAAVTMIDAIRGAPVHLSFSLSAVAEIELALLRLEQGRLDEASDALDAARRVRPAGELGRGVVGRWDAVRSALGLAHGDLPGARRAAERMPLGVWRDVTIARTLLAEDRSVEADEVLRPLSPVTPRQHVVVGLLHALASVDRSPEAARQHTVAAVERASAVGMYLTVVTAGPGVAALIETARWAAPAAWSARVATALALGSSPPLGPFSLLVEQPTTRERDTARYLASRLTIPEMARELGVSPNTLKSHLRGLYRKLGVTSRDEAVTVAREVGLLR